MKTKSVTRVSRATSDSGKSDDGPRPMRYERPSKRTPNASDRFYTDHQAEYEARGRRSEDLVARVEEHNNRYPKMRDELDHRRSISKPTALSAHREDGRRPHTTTCPVCGGFERQRRTKRKYQRTKSRITKRKPKPRKYRGKKPRTKAVYQHYSKARMFSMDTQTGDIGRDTFQDPRASTSVRIKRTESEIASRKSDADSKNPETHPSVSSYDSYLSIDHEPMD